MFSRLNWRRTWGFILTLVPLVTGSLVSMRVYAQIAQGSLSGTITATSGSGVPNALVSLKNLRNGATQSVNTMGDGSFTLRNVLPGTYEITASAHGFTDVRTTATIGSATERVVNLVMQPGRTAEASKGQVGASDVKGNVTTSVSELSLNGRSASDVAALEPGVATARTQASGQAQRGFGTEMTISGGRPRQNDSRLDGISVNDYSNGPPGSALGVNLGVDSVEQFSVLTSNYPAQYGRSSGASLGLRRVQGGASFTDRSMSSFETAHWTLGAAAEAAVFQVPARARNNRTETESSARPREPMFDAADRLERS